MRDPLTKKVVDIAPSGIRKFFDIVSEMDNVISLGVGEPDFDTPWHIRDEGIYSLEKGRTFYTSNAGLKELREEIVRYLERRIHVSYDPLREVLITVGGSEGIDMAFRAMLNPGDEVLIPAPYWLSYPDMVERAGGVPVTVHAGPERNFKVTPLMLEEKTTDKTRLLVLNSPSNPTGAVYSDREFMQIMRWALARNIFVLSDEIYDQLVFPPAKMTSAITWFEHCPELVAVLNGLSKSYAMTGWRVGFLAAHPDLVKKISSMQGHSTSSICSVSQKAALAALEGPVECVDEMRAAFLRRRDLALDIIKAWPWAVCPKPDGAFYLFVDVHQCYGDQVRNSTELCTYLLDKAHVALVPGAAFGDDNCIRLSYAVADDVLADALSRVGEVLGELAGETRR